VGYHYLGDYDVRTFSIGGSDGGAFTSRAYFNMSQFTLRLDNVSETGLYYGGGLLSNYWSDFLYDVLRFPEPIPYGSFNSMHDIGLLGVLGYSFKHFFVEINLSTGIFQSHGGENYRISRMFHVNNNRLSSFHTITLMAGYRFNFDISKRHKANCPKF
jgi:hypothetical protein